MPLDGPVKFTATAAAAMAFHGSTSFARRHCQYPRVGQISADGLELALPISTSCCSRHGVSPPLDAANSLEFAKHCSGDLLEMAWNWPSIVPGRCCACPRNGPAYLHMRASHSSIQLLYLQIYAYYLLYYKHHSRDKEVL